MADLASLEMKIKVLEEGYRKLSDIEAIKRLRHRYWRCIHQGLWDDLVDCFAEDAAIDYGFGIKLQGRKALTQFFKESMAPSNALVFPQGHNPEIDLTSDTTAKGIWQLDNVMVDAKTKVAVRHGASYDEEYAKVNGDWKIKRQKVTHVFRQPVQMEEIRRTVGEESGQSEE